MAENLRFGNQRAICEECGKDFPTKWSLTRHMRVHEYDVGSKCPHCTMSFPTKANLNAHTLKQHGIGELYTCEDCHKSFSYKKDLAYHIKHDVCKQPNGNAYQCDICSKSFLTKKYLRQHEIIHKAATLQCHICGKEFKWRSSLRKHLILCNK